MSYYLIYEQGSIDEGTETRIVGPFTYETHADEVFYQHSQGGAGWDERWEHVGSITGSVQGFRVEPATLLVDHYPQTPEAHEAAMERVRWLVGRGFEPIEIRHPRPLTPAQQKEREILGRMWSAHVTDMMERKTGLAGWFFGDGNPDATPHALLTPGGRSREDSQHQPRTPDLLFPPVSFHFLAHARSGSNA